MSRIMSNKFIFGVIELKRTLNRYFSERYYA